MPSCPRCPAASHRTENSALLSARSAHCLPPPLTSPPPALSQFLRPAPPATHSSSRGPSTPPVPGGSPEPSACSAPPPDSGLAPSFLLPSQRYPCFQLCILLSLPLPGFLLQHTFLFFLFCGNLIYTYLALLCCSPVLKLVEAGSCRKMLNVPRVYFHYFLWPGQQRGGRVETVQSLCLSVPGDSLSGRGWGERQHSIFICFSC